RRECRRDGAGREAWDRLWHSVYQCRRDCGAAQIFCVFHFPCLNSTALAAAMQHSAITIAMYTPLECKRIGIASQYARGISSIQKPKKCTIVGVTVSPAPLKAWSMTMP